LCLLHDGWLNKRYMYRASNQTRIEPVTKHVYSQ
jgi:hypothetical protein